MEIFFADAPLQLKSYDYFGRITDGIPLATAHPLCPLQTSTLSVLEKYPASGNIASVHCLVLRGMDLGDFVG
jgi:hypothetical protein